MSLVLSVNQLGTPRFLLRNRSASSHVQQNRTVFTRRHYRGKKELNVPRFRGEVYRVRSFKSTEGSKEVSSEKSLENDQWLLLQAWDVPWDWKIILYVMMPYLMSILLTGIVESAGLGVMQPHAENVTPHLHGTDEEAIRLFLDELLKTAVKLSVLYVFVSPYQPFPDNVFSYSINASLLGILGILAPLCEETIYRGFLMTSLTKWLPVPLSIIVSSIVFTLAHQSPGKSTEILIFGVVLGLVYAQTRNLLAPIIMHACWNLGVIFTLIYFQSQGQDIQKYVL
ncbi:PREDICTED: uncharacterized protein LOC104611555 isoform X3 [Nelumbo nucifera]|uniref:Uncharacterized protein LOC104611555 isoform X3 n=1 Tax=Nelumbo nucifera TaxID=4432 RepID=A0A1U8B7F2_NELNU|nr:PREDICTED: uncharacterized protein LOC104611555 isoform X3 [Nelumbo nucifera]